VNPPRQRLHPLSPLLHGAKFLAAIIAAVSVQGAVRLGPGGFVGLLLVVMCLAVAASTVSWLVTGYHVVGRELRIYDGVLVRRTRTIPLERLQAVDVVQPLLARMFGLAELRLEVVGGGKTEAPLAFLTVADAVALRERLLAVATRAGAPVAIGAPVAGVGGPDGAAPGTGGHPAPAPVAPAGADGGQAPPPPPGWAAGPPPAGAPAAGGVPTAPQVPEQHLHSVVNRDVVVSQLLTPPVLFLPVAVAVVIAQYVFDTGDWSLVVVASMIVAIVGVVSQPVRRILSDWNFRVSLQPGPHGPAGLRIRHGLTETRTQTVPLHRVQAVTVVWPRLWRHRRWLRVRIGVAGYSSPTPHNGVAAVDQLLPVGDLATARRLVPVVVPGADLSALPLSRPPARARWLAPLRQPILAAGCAAEVFATVDGWVTRQLTLVPYARIQSVRLVQGPLQRLLGLATVVADAAGSAHGTAAHRDLDEARRLADELTRRARAARAADRSARRTGRSAGGGPVHRPVTGVPTNPGVTGVTPGPGVAGVAADLTVAGTVTHPGPAGAATEPGPAGAATEPGPAAAAEEAVGGRAHHAVAGSADHAPDGGTADRAAHPVVTGAGGPLARPPAFHGPDHQERQPHVRPAGQDVDHPVLTGVDQGEGHGQRVGEQQRPPTAGHGADEEHHDEQRERGVQ
jgi:putative membrane protein